jgi:hypothetical protein
MRALELGHPTRLVVNGHDGEKRSATAGVEFHFPARGQHPPLVVHWQGRSLPPDEILAPLASTFPDQPRKSGLLILGEKGSIYTTHWNTNGLIRLEGEPRMTDITRHAATSHIPVSLPRPAVKGELSNPEKKRLPRTRCAATSPTAPSGPEQVVATRFGDLQVPAMRQGQLWDTDGVRVYVAVWPPGLRHWSAVEVA